MSHDDQPSLFEPPPPPRCPYCGGDASAPDHAAHCDGRQGRVEARASAPAPPIARPARDGDDAPSRGQDRYRRILSIYRQTSREAWASVSALLPFVDARIVTAIEERDGATCDEVEQVTGFAHQTVSAQIRHLYEAGLLTDTTDRRPTRSGRPATVWVSVTQREQSA